MAPLTQKQAVSPRAAWWGLLLLGAATLAAYHPVWHAGFIWDDSAHVTPPALQGFRGLLRIWSDPRATQQYYPVLYTAFWLEHLAWGDAPGAYHLANILFHIGAACLLYRLLKTLEVPGALLAASVFALHPVNVESVAWISEQKNTLSAVFYFAAALAYLRFERARRLAWYAAASGLFLLALLSKSVTATLPAALLVILWWKRGRLSFRSDIVPLLPWLILGAGTGALTAWLERTHVGATGAAFDLSAGARLLIAGHALWFYLGKIFWPAGLIFIYPRWTIDAGELSAYVYPLAAAAVLVGFWMLRRRSRAPLASALLFSGTLFPALGFVNVFPFLYSFVADHFQYLALTAVVAALAAAATLAARRLSPALQWAAVAAVAFLVGVLGVLTWRQCAMYTGMEPLWRATIARNPSCWMAYNNLAAQLLVEGKVDEAVATVQTGLGYDPDNAAAHATLGQALARQGRPDESYAQLERALALEPNNAAAHIDLAAGFLQATRFDEAIAHYKAALEIAPDSAKAHSGLGDAYLRTSLPDDAILEYQRALADDPRDASARANLGTALMQKGRPAEAMEQFESAVRLKPDLAVAQFNLGNALLQAGRNDEAREHYRKAIDASPDLAAAHANLGYALLLDGQAGEAAAELQRALVLDPRNAEARKNLADALSRAR